MIKFTNYTMNGNFDCGPTSLAMLLSAYNINDYSPGKLAKILKTTRRNGTEWKKMRYFLLGLKEFKIESVENKISKAKKLLDESTPLLICWDVLGNPDYSHYSLLVKMASDEVILLDPNDRKRFSKHKLFTFLEYWSPYRFWFVRLIPKKKSVAKYKSVGTSALMKQPERGILNAGIIEQWIREAR